jgi:hypothetical protein
MRQGDGIVSARRNAYQKPYTLDFASGFLPSGGIPRLSFLSSILLGQLVLA